MDTQSSISGMHACGLAYAKINISLDIVSKMDNGYHSLKTIMQSIDLCDEITLKCVKNNKSRENNTYVIDPGLPFLPHDERNITVKAAKVFFDFYKITGYDVRIKVNKNIPVSAGLGGGSADGACILRMLYKMFNIKPERNELIDLGSAVGSDVPFCIFGGTMLAEGRGDILTSVAPLPSCYFVVCKPFFSCSTPELFKRIIIKKIKLRPDTDFIISSLANRDINGVARSMYNVFEDFMPSGSGEVEEIRCVMLDKGALAGMMTGSGPTVFGIFVSLSDAQDAYQTLKQEYKDVFIAQPTNELIKY